MPAIIPQKYLDDIKANALKVDPFKLLIEGVDFPAGPSFPPGELDRLKAPLDEQLVTSICKHGVIRHILAKRDGEAYHVVDGRRRVMHARAASVRLVELGQDPLRVPVALVKGDEMALFGLSRIANAFALQDKPITNAKNAQWMLDKGASNDEVALAFGVKPVTIKDWLDLLDLAPSIQAEVEAGTANGGITTNAALELAPLSMADQVKALNAAREATGGKPTTRDITAAARTQRGSGDKPVKKTPSERVKAVQTLLETLAKEAAEQKVPTNPPPADSMFTTLRKIALLLNDRKWDSLVKSLVVKPEPADEDK